MVEEEEEENKKREEEGGEGEGKGSRGRSREGEGRGGGGGVEDNDGRHHSNHHTLTGHRIRPYHFHRHIYTSLKHCNSKRS